MAQLKSTVIQGTLSVTDNISENGTPLVNKYLGIASKAVSASSADSVPWTGVSGRPSNATSTAPGLMSAADKAKLDTVASNANAYTLPKATTTGLGGIIVGDNLTVSSTGKLSANPAVSVEITGAGNVISTLTAASGVITAEKGITALTAETPLTTAASGSGNVVTDITVSGHQITKVKGISALTSLATGSSGSGNVVTDITVSGNTITKVKGITALTAETTLTTAATGTGNVVSDITVSGHQITKVKGINALTSLATGSSGSGNVVTDITVSGNTITKVKGITALTAETQLSTAASGSGNVVTDITVSGHKITKVKGITALTEHSPVANTTRNGLMSTAAQTFAGDKVFSGNVSVGNATLSYSTSDGDNILTISFA